MCSDSRIQIPSVSVAQRRWSAVQTFEQVVPRLPVDVSATPSHCVTARPSFLTRTSPSTRQTTNQNSRVSSAWLPDRLVFPHGTAVRVAAEEQQRRQHSLIPITCRY
ncbi:hypothetical protein O3P69_004413 [Scylla paramamosain]|uniref:Uncharacterized protein n=1 Tax=Scylla paramamosain TaxID=85552 RepID=A0AAW0UEF6_SCYPA